MLLLKYESRHDIDRSKVAGNPVMGLIFFHANLGMGAMETVFEGKVENLEVEIPMVIRMMQRVLEMVIVMVIIIEEVMIMEIIEVVLGIGTRIEINIFKFDW